MIMNNKLKDMPNELFYYCGIYSGLKSVLEACDETINKHPDIFTDDITKYKLLVSTIESFIKDTPERLKNDFGVDINDIMERL